MPKTFLSILPSQFSIDMLYLNSHENFWIYLRSKRSVVFCRKTVLVHKIKQLFTTQKIYSLPTTNIHIYTYGSYVNYEMFRVK